jgi:hypothetical protein
MVPKDVRELLYRLLKDHYVQVQVRFSPTQTNGHLHFERISVCLILHEFLSFQFLHVDVLVTFVLHSLSSHVGIQPFPTRAYWTMFACLQVARQLC